MDAYRFNVVIHHRIFGKLLDCMTLQSQSTCYGGSTVFTHVITYDSWYVMYNLNMKRGLHSYYKHANLFYICPILISIRSTIRLRKIYIHVLSDILWRFNIPEKTSLGFPFRYWHCHVIIICKMTDWSKYRIELENHWICFNSLHVMFKSIN